MLSLSYVPRTYTRRNIRNNSIHTTNTHNTIHRPHRECEQNAML